MKKMFATILMATTALLFQTVEASDPRYGYFYLNETVELPSSLDGPTYNPAVSWDGAINGVQGIHSEGIYVNPEDPTTVVIKHPGTYLVTYSTTVEQVSFEDDYEPGQAQFGLFLNGYLVPGSVYATGNAYPSDFISEVFNVALGQTGELSEDYSADTQVNGQALVVVTDHQSYLSLQNYGENDLILSATAGSDDPSYGANVSASILINRIDKHHDDQHSYD